jgi:hypothetical protein
MNPILPTVPGGLLALGGGLMGIGLSARQERSRWLRDAHLRTSTEVLSALQTLMRRMIDLSYLDDKKVGERATTVLSAYHEATVQWNNALYAVLLIAPPETVPAMSDLDREVDRLLELAHARVWDREGFRRERIQLGRMAADYLRLARRQGGMVAIELASIWTWDADVPGNPSP